MGRRKKQVLITPESNGANAAAGPITKMEAVRKALAEGKETALTALPYIKEQFGLVMTSNHFSNCKSTIRGTKGKRRGKRGRRRAIITAPKPAIPVARIAPVRRSSGDPLAAARQVKELCYAYGADTIRGLVDLFGR